MLFKSARGKCTMKLKSEFFEDLIHVFSLIRHMSMFVFYNRGKKLCFVVS